MCKLRSWITALGVLTLTLCAATVTHLRFSVAPHSAVRAQPRVNLEESPTATLQPGPIATPSPVSPMPTAPKESPTRPYTPTATPTATPTTPATMPATPTPTETLAFVRYMPVVLRQSTILQTSLVCRLEQTAIQVGEQTTLFIEVLNVTDLYGYQLDLYFDPDVVQLSGVVQDGIEGMILGDFLSPDFVVNNEIDNEFGVVFIALTQINPSPARSGSGELARAVVSGIQPGVSEFSFESAILANSSGNEIARRLQNCLLSVEEGSLINPPPK
jgi:hypothetical protein